jgi:hypothetical protein
MKDPTGSARPANAPPPPAQFRIRLGHLEGKRDTLERARTLKSQELQKVSEYLGIAEEVDNALDTLSEQLFGKIVTILEEKLTLALQEVLGQPIRLKVTRKYKRGGATVGFHIERRDGEVEDIMKGQGGSVANVLSVGLRLFALKQLDPAIHRHFLVLDEQDCWLRPDLVPRFVSIVQQAGRALGFQVLMISHHEISSFERYADKLYEFVPSADEVIVQERTIYPRMPDE